MRNHRVAATALGGIERPIRGFDQLGRRLILLRYQRVHADADRHKPARRFSMRNEEIFDRPAPFFGKRVRTLESNARQQQRKFLATITGNKDRFLQSNQ